MKDFPEEPGDCTVPTDLLVPPSCLEQSRLQTRDDPHAGGVTRAVNSRDWKSKSRLFPVLRLYPYTQSTSRLGLDNYLVGFFHNDCPPLGTSPQVPRPLSPSGIKFRDKVGTAEALDLLSVLMGLGVHWVGTLPRYHRGSSQSFCHYDPKTPPPLE